MVLEVLRERRQSRSDEGYLRLETQSNVAPRFALSRLRFGALLSSRIKTFTGAGRRRGDDGFLRFETQGNVAPRVALSRLRFGALLSNRIKTFTGAKVKPGRRRLPDIRNPE